MSPWLMWKVQKNIWATPTQWPGHLLMPKHGTPGWFLFLRESTGAQLGQGGCSSLLDVSSPGSGLFWLLQPAQPLPSSLLVQQDPCGLSWVACSQSAEVVTPLVLGCLWPAPDTLLAPALLCQGWCRPSAGWALLCEDHLPPWGPSPLLPAPCCCLSAILCHLAGPPPVCHRHHSAKLSEGDTKQLDGYFNQSVHYICKSVKNTC